MHFVKCARCAFRREADRGTGLRLQRVGAAPTRCTSLPWLHQLTRAKVMFSRSARVRIGPLRNGLSWRTHSALQSPIVVSHSALSLVINRARSGGDRSPAWSLGGRARATGRPVYAINPLAVARYRECHSVARSKSDHADARTLANNLRVDAHLHHRPVAAAA